MPRVAGLPGSPISSRLAHRVSGPARPAQAPAARRSVRAQAVASPSVSEDYARLREEHEREAHAEHLKLSRNVSFGSLDDEVVAALDVGRLDIAVDEKTAPTNPVARFWASYQSRIKEKPMSTKGVTSLIGFMLGDLLAQRVGGEHFNPARCLRLGAYGLTVDGPLGHKWYEILDRTIKPDKPTSTTAVLLKTAADQVVWAPIMTVVFFVFLKSIEGHPELILETVQDKLIKTVAANYLLWPMAHFINFRFVPTEHRILYNNCVSIFWNAFLSTFSHADLPSLDTDSIADAVSSVSDAVAETAARLPEPLQSQAARVADLLGAAWRADDVDRWVESLPPGFAKDAGTYWLTQGLHYNLRLEMPRKIEAMMTRLHP